MKKRDNESDELVFLPLGGAGEIGMNLYVYGFGPGDNKKWVIVDMGVTFAGPKEPGINLIFPDISFLQERTDQIVGAFITHAHEDHIGAVSHLWSRLKMPVYASPFAGLMLKGKLLELDLYGDVPVQTINVKEKYKAGPFEIEPFSVTHSIPEAMGFIIKAGGQTLVHTGDWRIDDTPILDGKTDFERLREVGKHGCDFLVCDSTNVLSGATSLSETDIGENLTTLIKQAPARVVVTTFASNVARIGSLIKTAVDTGRHPILSGRSMDRSILLARELGILKDLPSFVAVEEVKNLPRDKVLIIATGSQGETRAQTAKIAAGEHSHIELDEGDWVVFSSKTIPGNERDVMEVENQFAKRGVRVITSDQEPIHETGHPRQGELKQLYDTLKPTCLLPMHGEARHLMAHAAYASQQGIEKFVIAYNGDMVRLFPGEPDKIAQVKTGRLYEDGRLITEGEYGPVKARRKLAYVGCVALSLVVTDRGDLVSEPVMMCDGLPDMDAAGTPFEDLLMDAVYSAFESVPRKNRGHADKLTEVIRRAVRRRASMVWGKKPQTYVLVSVV